jgi:hypothetical protein
MEAITRTTATRYSMTILLNLKFSFDTKKRRSVSARCFQARAIQTHISNGYTIAFANTAPVAPATALPQGERRGGFDWLAIEDVSMQLIGQGRQRLKATYYVRIGLV